MTDQEFERFVTHVYTCFPSVREFIFKNSPNPKGTEGLWRETLRPYSLAECAIVIDAWASGKRQGFQAYERDQIALLIKQSIESDRDGDRRRESHFNGADANRFEFARKSRREIEERRKAYQPTAMASPGLRDAYLHGRELMAKRDKGEITIEEFDRQKQLLIDRV